VPSPTSTIRTTSPYFSPKSAMAPQPLGLVERRGQRRTGVVAQDPRVDLVLDVAALLLAQALRVGEVEAQLVGPT
jgi:hypothetical protein